MASPLVEISDVLDTVKQSGATGRYRFVRNPGFFQGAPDTRGRGPASCTHNAGKRVLIFASEDIQIIKTPIQAPRANAIMERWVGSCRRELLDRVLILNARHLRQVLAVYEAHDNTHRPHRSLSNAAPLRPLDDPETGDIKVIRRDRLGGVIHEYAQVA